MNTSDFSKTSIKGIKKSNSNQTYLLDFTKDKKRFRKVLSVSTLDEAQVALDSFKSDIEKQSTIEVDIGSTVNDYWETLRVIKKWKTSYDKMLNFHYKRNIEPILGKMKVTDVKPKHFTQLNISQSHLGTRSQKTSYELLTPIFNLAIEDELIVHSPIKKVHVPVRKQLEEKKIITNAEVKVKYIYQALNTYFGSDRLFKINNHPTIKEVQCHNNPHHLALFLFGFHGRRLNEVTSLRWSDINFFGRTYLIRAESSKVKVDMTFQLTEDVKNALDLMDGKIGSDELIFSVKQVQKHYARIRAISAIPDFSYHWMRNLIVSALASQGVDTTHLSAMLGHTDTSTLKKYLSLQREASTSITNEATSNLLGLNQDFTEADYWETEEA